MKLEKIIGIVLAFGLLGGGIFYASWKANPGSPAPTVVSTPEMPAPPSKAPEDACANDLKRLCAPYTMPMCASNCLVFHEKDLDDECRAALPMVRKIFEAKIQAAKDIDERDNANIAICKDDTKKFCPEQKFRTSCGRTCLQLHADELSPECRQIIHAGVPDPAVKACAGELRRLCPDDAFENCGGPCLVLQANRVKGECAKFIPEIKKNFAAWGKHAGPALMPPMKNEQVCQTEVDRLCPKDMRSWVTCSATCLRLKKTEVRGACADLFKENPRSTYPWIHIE